MAEGEEDAILPLACRRVASGATHFVQIVDVEVLKIVDRTVFTCSVGLPPAGVTVLVTGQDVTVVWILEVMLVTDRSFLECPDLHLRCHNLLSAWRCFRGYTFCANCRC